MSAGAVLLLAALWFLCDWRDLAAIFMAAGAHEAGHLAALAVCGCRVTGFRADISGGVILRSGALTPLPEALCALAGPAAGLIFALSASVLGRRLCSSLLTTAAGVSLVLSAFNLIPALPLDGGRALSALAGEGPARLCSLASASALLLAGLALTARGCGLGLFIAAVWLTLLQADL